MLKLNKILSIFTSFLIGGALLCGTVNAEEKTEETKMYTLEELFAMSDEEFLSLSTDEFDVETRIENATPSSYPPQFNRILGISSTLIYYDAYGNTNLKDYVANITELKLEKLLGDTVEYEIYSPIYDYISVDNDGQIDKYYLNELKVSAPELSTETAPTHEEVVKLVKFTYCVNQVIPSGYSNPFVPGEMPPIQKLKIGDVNFDWEVNISDAVYMAKFSANFFQATELQNEMGDLNVDGNFNTLDIIILVESLLGNYESI